MSSIFPSKNTWATPRTTVAKLDSNNCMIILPQKISEIKKVIVNAESVDVIFGQSGETSSRMQKLSTLYFEQNLNSSVQNLDITDYVVEEARYNTLETKNVNAENLIIELCTNNAHYYAHNGNIIYVIGKTFKGSLSFWAKTSAWNMAIQASFEKILANNTLYNYNANTQQFTPIYSRPLNVASLKNNPMSAQFRIYYTPLGESVKLDVPKTNPQANPFCIPYSQQQPIVDNVSHGREMQSIANRTGCEKKEVVRTIPHAKYLRKIGSAWFEKDEQGNLTGNVWRLTRNQIKFYSPFHIVVMETWSKNWSYRSENVPINREFRSWNIPADIVQRNLHWQEYCLITKNKDIELPQTAFFSTEARQELLRGLESSYNADKFTECTNMWYRFADWSDNKTGNGAVMTCSAFGFGNSLVFTGKTKDNLSAGVQRVRADDKDDNYQFCKDVYYCNDDGKLDILKVQFASEIDSGSNTVAEYKYPEAGVDWNCPSGLLLFNTPDGQQSPNYYAALRVLKDPCEQLNFTYQLHLLTDSGLLVIGSSWAETNPLVQERKENRPVKVWKLRYFIPAGAKVMTDIYGTEYTGNQSDLFEVDRVNGTITFKPVTVTEDDYCVGICVTDGDNNVLIAYQNVNGATYYTKYTHDYKAIARAIPKHLGGWK